MVNANRLMPSRASRRTRANLQPFGAIGSRRSRAADAAVWMCSAHRGSRQAGPSRAVNPRREPLKPKDVGALPPAADRLPPRQASGRRGRRVELVAQVFFSMRKIGSSPLAGPSPSSRFVSAAVARVTPRAMRRTMTGDRSPSRSVPDPGDGLAVERCPHIRVPVERERSESGKC